MNTLIQFIIMLTIFLLIILAVGLYIYLKERIEKIKEVKDKTFIERADAEIKRLKSTD